jgi:hypothetical protein
LPPTNNGDNSSDEEIIEDLSNFIIKTTNSNN